MTQAPDRKKLRREYLWKKSSAYLAGASWSLVLLPSLSVFITFAFACLGCLWSAIRYGSLESLYISACFGGLAVYAGVWLMGCWQGIADAKKDAAIAYVPPVTAATLPAEEILVRGSEEPVIAESEVLLRAANGQETPKEELLRATDGSMRD